MTLERRKARLIAAALGALSLCVGGAAAALHHEVRAGILEQIGSAEAAIRADISRINAASAPAAIDAAAADKRIIREARIQLALAALQEVVRTAVEDHGGDIASMSGADPVEQPWGATIRLTARFETPHASIIDIFAALETGEPFVRIDEASLSSRTSPGGGDAAVTLVSVEAAFSAFASARPTDR